MSYINHERCRVRPGTHAKPVTPRSFISKQRRTFSHVPNLLIRGNSNPHRLAQDSDSVLHGYAERGATSTHSRFQSVSSRDHYQYASANIVCYAFNSKARPMTRPIASTTVSTTQSSLPHLQPMTLRQC